MKRTTVVRFNKRILLTDRRILLRRRATGRVLFLFLLFYRWNPKEIFEKDWRVRAESAVRKVGGTRCIPEVFRKPAAVAKNAFDFAPVTLVHPGKIARKKCMAPHLGRSSISFQEEK